MPYFVCLSVWACLFIYTVPIFTFYCLWEIERLKIYDLWVDVTGADNSAPSWVLFAQPLQVTSRGPWLGVQHPVSDSHYHLPVD